jgi:hypothetical protein
MSEVISKIVEDNRMISMESVIDNLSAFLTKAPEKGVPFTELVFENPNKKLDIYFSVYYLSLIEDLFEEKNRFAKNIIENHENLIPSLQRFVNRSKYRTKPESPYPTRLNQVFPSKATDAKNLIPHETNCKTESHQISSYRAPDSTRTTQPLTPTKSQSPTTATNSLNDAIVSLEFPLN